VRPVLPPQSDGLYEASSRVRCLRASGDLAENLVPR